MEKLIQSLLTNKGTRSYRTVLLAVAAYTAMQVNSLDKRVAVIEEAHRVRTHYSAVTTNQVAQLP